MPTIKTADFNLKHTLECGQFFRYFPKNNGYYVQTRDKIFFAEQTKDILKFKGKVSTDFIKNFFRLDEDHKKITKELKKDANLKEAIESCNGIRLIRQDPWECLISYVCSTCSNIPRIQKNLNALSKEHGNLVSIDNFESFSFPEPKTLQNIKKIKSCGVGYRDKYIIGINRNIDSKFIHSLKHADYQEAKNKLKKLPGVGDKVADCVLLFSLDRLNSFPIDTWIKNIMEKLYFNGKKTSEKKIREYAKEKFGKNAGYAQQYLFHYHRNIKNRTNI